LPDPGAHERQLSGLLTQVAQFGLQATHSPFTDTFFLSLEHSPVHYPVSGLRLSCLGHDVQKSTLLRQVRHLGSHGRHILFFWS